MRCPQCSTENADGAAACSSCGAALTSGAPTAPAAPAAAPAAPAARAKRPRRPVSLFALWLHRLALVVLLVLFLSTQVRLVFMSRELDRTKASLESARGTIQQAVTSGAESLQRLHAIPPDGQPQKLDLKLAACTVDSITFAGDQVTLGISNPGAAATKPFVHVALFDADGRQVGEGNVVDFLTTSFQPGETKSLSDRVRASGDEPRYFAVDDRR